MKKNSQEFKKHKLIVTIVKKGMGSKVVATTKKSGAQGGTILLGRGTASKDIYQRLLGIAFETEKEIVLTLVNEDYLDNVLDTIIKAAKLNKPGKGIAFVIDVKKYIGIAHLFKNE